MAQRRALGSRSYSLRRAWLLSFSFVMTKLTIFNLVQANPPATSIGTLNTMLSTLNTAISTLTTMIGTSVMDLERRMVVHAARYTLLATAVRQDRVPRRGHSRLRQPRWPVRSGRLRLGPVLTSAPGLGSPLPQLHRDWAHPCHICTGTLLIRATSAPGLGSPVPHLRRDCAHPDSWQ